MPITFPNLVGSLATAYKIGKPFYDWLSDKQLKLDFQQYLAELETRRVLYVEWEYENILGVLKSLEEILSHTRSLRLDHFENRQSSSLLLSLIKVIQKQMDVIRGCDMHTTQGEFMAYRALLKVRTEIAKVLSVFCGMLGVHPHSREMEQFIMNMAVVRPSA